MIFPKYMKWSLILFGVGLLGGFFIIPQGIPQGKYVLLNGIFLGLTFLGLSIFVVAGIRDLLKNKR